MSTIVLTTDHSQESQRAFAPTVKLANELDKNIVLLHVVPELAALPYGSPYTVPVRPSSTEQGLKDAQDILQNVAAGLGSQVQAEVVAATDVSQAIVKFAEEAHADFIALSTHGRTGFRRLVMGSVAERVMRHATTPVICFPQKEA